MGLGRAAHNEFGVEDEPVESRGTATRSGNRSSASSAPDGDEHGDALDHGAECRHPHARSLDCARAGAGGGRAARGEGCGARRAQ